MQMNSVPRQLSSEDRTEYERILDEALRTTAHHPELGPVSHRLNTEQLRSRALEARALITAAATTEYDAYVTVRTEARATAPRTTGDGAPEPTGAGVLAVLAVLAPVLAGSAAVIFLLVGYALRALSPGLAIGRTLLATGWVFGAITAAAILVAAAGLLFAALRNNATALRAAPRREIDERVELARAAWRDALVEHGIVPFLRNALANAPKPDAGAAGTGGTYGPATPAGAGTSGRMPHLGYHRPGFSSPDRGATGPRPSYSSPDFSSPDFGGPEHPPE
ncbi:hypothetical protein ACFV0R_03370 [Streptomyces sp. NPDC059578]|uniref:hypothetical protein n=1 Tax=unclassified Streptomyces TaxID=2593676 RepID=UPI0036691AC3